MIHVSEFFLCLIIMLSPMVISFFFIIGFVTKQVIADFINSKKSSKIIKKNIDKQI